MPEVAAAPVVEPNSAPSQARVIIGRMVRHPLGACGIFIVLVTVIFALFSPWIAPFDPALVDYEAILVPPSALHLLGTDDIGRDILSRIIYGSRVSLQIVGVSVFVSLIAGGAIGLVSGYVGGQVDNIIMRFMDALLAFPLLILALAMIAVLGPDLINAMIAITVVNIPGFARLVRGQVLSVREMDFILAARSVGMSDTRIMILHILPSVAGNVIVYASLRASSVLIIESSLAFLGLGAQPPTPSWGQMLATSMQYWDAWWMSIFPGAAIFLAALAFNFIGDALRDALDVRSVAS